MVRLPKLYRALRIDRSQGEVLKEVARREQVSGASLDKVVRIIRKSGKKVRMSEGLVYKNLHMLEGTDSRGFALIERVLNKSHRKSILYKVTEMGAVATFGFWGIRTRRLEEMKPWGELLTLSDRLMRDRKELALEFDGLIARLARRLSVFTTTKHGPSYLEASLLTLELLNVMRLMRLREDIEPEHLAFLRLR